MIQAPPGQYYAAAPVQQQQQYPSAPSYQYAAAQPVVSYQQVVVQRQRGSHWSILCCFKGQNSIHLRHGCMVFGGLIVAHGVISMIFAFLYALGKINRSDGGAGEFYALFIAPLSALFLSGVNKAFPIVTSFLHPLAVDICGGGCLILAGVFLKETFCYVSIATNVVALIGNLFNTIVIFLLTLALLSFRNGDASNRLYFLHATIFRLGACIYLVYCIFAALALKDQIRDGEYVQWAAAHPQQQPVPSVAALPTAPVMMGQSMVMQTGANDEGGTGI